MKMCARLVAAAASLLVALVPSVAGASLRFDAVSAKNRPVSKVITLLKDMLKQLEKEAEEDEEIYDKMACWCETNDKEKTKSVADAQQRIADLTTKVEEYTASSSRLGTEIKNLEKEVGKNEKALAEATSLRQKQLAEFNAEEKDLLGSISALKSASAVLSKHHSASSLLQTSRSHMRVVATTLQHQLRKHAPLLEGVLTRSQRRVAASFIQTPEYFEGLQTEAEGGLQTEGSYEPQSGEVFGIIQQMQETFEANLATSQKEESENQKTYSDLKSAKEAEISAGSDQRDAKVDEKADTDEKNAHAKQDIEDTKTSLSADEKFVLMLKEKCSMTDEEWERRQKTRQLEMEAVGKALSLLSGDDAHDLFSKTFNPALLQKESEVLSERRARASKVLTSVANRLHRPRLATLAMKVRLDAFTRVKKSIDDMVNALLKEKEAEIKHKDFCVEEFNQNAAQTEDKQRAKDDADAAIDDLTGTVSGLNEATNDLKTDVSEMQIQMKRAGEDREKQNKEFQMTVSDQRETQKMLKAALRVLEDFYGKQSALLQQMAEQPAGFEEYKKSSGSGGVMGMLEQIIQDAKAMEADAIRSEEDSQRSYEDFVKETNASIETKMKDIVNKSEEKAKAESELVEAKETKESTALELEQLANYKAELHSSCDFIMKNFDLRQEARDEEIEALKQAKAILSGANFGEFLQNPH